MFYVQTVLVLILIFTRIEESFLRSRIAIGNTMNKQRIVEEAASQGYDASIVTRAIAIMVRKGEMVERNQGRLFRRVK